MHDLQIAIPCGPNSEYFANFLIETIEFTISKKLNYRFLIGVNKPGVNKDEITKNHDTSKFDFVEELSSATSSLGHAHCLNLMLRSMNSKFGIFLDSDVAVLEKEWDVLLLNSLNDKTIMIGSEYHHSDGKMVNKPNVITCAFDVEIFKNLKLDFTPSLKKIITTPETASYYGTQIGESIMLDTGCEIMETISKNGYQTEVLKIISSRYRDTSSKLKILDTSQRGEEYHLNGRPISTHIGRSLTRNFKNDLIVKTWKDSVERWLYGKI
jgi:hypothetical protein